MDYFAAIRELLQAYAWLIILIAAVASAVGVLIAAIPYALRTMGFATHGAFRCLILQKRPYGYVKIGQKKVRADREKFTYKGKTYILNPARVAFHNPLPVLLYELGNPEPLVITWRKDQGLSPSLVHEVLHNNVVKQVIQSVRKAPTDYLMLIVFLALGALLGYIIGNYAPLTPHAPGPSTPGPRPAP